METVLILLMTTLGNITLELYPEKAPVTVDNFVQYVDEGYYNGTVFHRVMNDFMIQGGGFDVQMNKKATRPPIKNEADNGLRNDKYTVAMARTQIPDSASSQFFINTKSNVFLNHKSKTINGYGYAVFGRVVKGMDVVDKIEKVSTTTKGPHQNVPVKEVVILEAKVITTEKSPEKDANSDNAKDKS